jgi:hypothetical protein
MTDPYSRAERERARQVALAAGERRRAAEGANYDTAWRSRDADMRHRKQLFDAINAFIGQRAGHVVSLPGAAIVQYQCSPSLAPALTAALQGLGYAPRHTGQTMRLDALGVTEIIVEQDRGGTPVETVRRHPGLVSVDIYEIVLR